MWIEDQETQKKVDIIRKTYYIGKWMSLEETDRRRKNRKYMFT